MANEIKVIISAKDAASAVINAVGQSINNLAYEFKQADIKFGNLKTVANNLIDAGSKMVMTGGAVLAGFAMAVSKATQLNEVQEKFKSVMGESIEKAEGFSKTLVSSYGMSEKGAKSALGTIGNLLNGLGVDTPIVADLSNEFVKLASDLGSFNKVKTENVLEVLQKAIVGNYKGLKQYGIVINDTEIKQTALNMGLIKAGQEMTNTAKSSALLSLILSKTPKAIGATKDNFNDLSDQIDRLKNRFDDLISNIGQSLIPMIEKIIIQIEPIINSVIEWIGANKELVTAISTTSVGISSFILVGGAFIIFLGTAIKNVILLKKEILLLKAISGFAIPITVILTSAGVIAAELKQLWDLHSAIKSNAESWKTYDTAFSATIPDITKFNKETGNQVSTMLQLSHAAQQQGWILDKNSDTWIKTKSTISDSTKALEDNSNTISVLGAVYSKLRDIATDAFDEIKNKIQALDNEIKKSDFAKAGILDKYNKIFNEINRQSIERTGDSLDVWNDKFKEAATATHEASNLMQKASVELDKVTREELLKLAMSKIDNAVNISTGLTDAVKKVDAAGNETIIQTADESSQKVKSLLVDLKSLEIGFVDINKKSAQTEKSAWEIEAEKFKGFLDGIPKEIDPKLKFKIDKTSLDHVTKIINKISGNKTLKFDFSNQTSETSESSQDISNGMATGGSIPGYGGGDRINILAEAGEFIVRKEAVKKFGAGLFAMLNNFKTPNFGIPSDLISSIPLPKFNSGSLAFASGGIVPNLQIKNLGQIDLNIGNKIYPVMGDLNVLETLKTELRREKLKRQI